MMSYFICGYKTQASVIDAYAELFAAILPPQIANDTLRLENGSSSLLIYGNTKAIPNISIRDDREGSWLALIGTPLVRLKSERQGQALLREFLDRPGFVLSHNLDGNFASFAYDAPRNRLLAATDFNNTTPIFYVRSPKGIILSSHELPLGAFLNSKIDPFGFSQLIHMGVTWESHTRFREIKKMLPCEIDIFENGKEPQTQRYWRPQEETTWPVGFNAHVKRWIPMLRESVSQFYESSNRQPAIADLTGGEDSRLVIALCHDLGIPFTAHVTGSENDVDVIIARKAAKKAGFALLARTKNWISVEQLLANALNINLESDAYQDFFAACVEYATDRSSPLDDSAVVKYCGAPGGEAFRGSYYLRGKALFPSRKKKLDVRFFVKMKYLLDYYPGLTSFSDDDFLQTVHTMANANLEDVREFPIGIQIDHLLRIFQTCFIGLKYKNPLYLPFATNPLTRSIYSISPLYKRGGRLSKACTEILFPELAFIKSQTGVPTIRKTFLRTPLFLPEYLSTLRKISSGAASRLWKWKDSNKWYFSHDLNAYMFIALLNNPPYSHWFSSTQTMITGDLYRPDVADPILSRAKTGSCRCLPILGRMISQELAFRWASKQGSQDIA
jgi:hypothetical protein